jgi:hypothetical protein
MAIRTNRNIRLLGLAAAASAALITAACGTSAETSTGKTSGSTSGAAASPSPSPKAFTGTQLKSMLVTTVPTGFKLNATATADSGEALQIPSTGPVAAKSKCGSLNATSFITTTGMSGVSFAQSDYIDAKDNEISQEIDTFGPGIATTVLTRMRQVFAQCAKFSYKAAGVTASERVKVSAVTGLGDEAVRAVITAPQFLGGTTLVVVRVGDNVVSAFYNDTTGSYDDGHINDLVSKIVTNVQAGT